MGQNIYAPIPTGIHLVFCAISTIFLLVMFAKYKRPYYLLLTLGIDLTLLTQIIDEYKYINILGLVEILICVSILVLYIIRVIKNKKADDYDFEEAEKEKLISHSDFIFKQDLKDKFIQDEKERDNDEDYHS